eukprot:3590970-Rhodomonas_salina.2
MLLCSLALAVRLHRRNAGAAAGQCRQHAPDHTHTHARARAHTHTHTHTQTQTQTRDVCGWWGSTRARRPRWRCCRRVPTAKSETSQATPHRPSHRPPSTGSSQRSSPSRCVQLFFGSMRRDLGGMAVRLARKRARLGSECVAFRLEMRGLG